MQKCLMIQTRDQRQFFTYEKNLFDLIEFSKTFRAEISIVKTDEDVEVLDIQELIPVICTKTKTDKIDVNVIETIEV